jgi:trimeric autotransporter adhesin
VDVVPGPVADYTFTFTGCLHDAAQFNAPATSGTFTLDRWQWNFGDATTSNAQNPTKMWTAPGTYNVALRVISPEGCFGDVTKPVVVDPLPIAAVVADSIAICSGQTATFQASGLVAGSTYKWYTTPTGGTPIQTGTSFTTPVLTASTQYYLEVTNAGLCNSNRKRVVAQVYNQLAAPVVTVEAVGAYFARWKWTAVPGATGYQVSVNGGTYTAPSSGTGPTALTHTATSLTPTTSYTLNVRALGVIPCQTSTATASDTTTLTDQIYIPNTFTPNGDGKNDWWKVYGNVITGGEMAVFNQWGEKIFETKDLNTGWDGRYKGTVQPVGVYVYVVKLTLENGEQVTRKGVINLVR